MKEKFIQFLKDNGALEKFEAAIADNSVRFDDDEFTTIDGFIDKHPNPKGYLGRAFVWSVSDNGYEYWVELFVKWRDSL